MPVASLMPSHNQQRSLVQRWKLRNGMISRITSFKNEIIKTVATVEEEKKSLEWRVLETSGYHILLVSPCYIQNRFGGGNLMKQVQQSSLDLLRSGLHRQDSRRTTIPLMLQQLQKWVGISRLLHSSGCFFPEGVILLETWLWN